MKDTPPTAAYCEGYADGYLRGYDNNPYQDHRRSEYRHGYDAGVSAYCHENHPEDENE